MLLGVVASDIRLAVRALRDYCAALGLPFLVRAAGRGYWRAGVCWGLACAGLLPERRPWMQLLVDDWCPSRLMLIPIQPTLLASPVVQVPESRVAGVTAAPGIQGAVYIKYNSATRLCYAR